MKQKQNSSSKQSKRVGVIVSAVLLLFFLVVIIYKTFKYMYKPKNTKFWDSVKYFQPSEFDSPDQKGSGVNMQPELIFKLDAARDDAGIPFKINSGYRTNYWNAKQGGVKNSEHMLGLAADIDVKPDGSNFWTIYKALKAQGFKRLGLYFNEKTGESFIHAGISKVLPQSGWARWNGQKVKPATFLAKAKKLA